MSTEWLRRWYNEEEDKQSMVEKMIQWRGRQAIDVQKQRSFVCNSSPGFAFEGGAANRWNEKRSVWPLCTTVPQRKERRKEKSSCLHLKVKLTAERLKSQPWVRPALERKWGTSGSNPVPSAPLSLFVFLKELQHKVRLLSFFFLFCFYLFNFHHINHTRHK